LDGLGEQTAKSFLADAKIVLGSVILAHGNFSLITPAAKGLKRPLPA
jgi:hypothetical protein